MCRAALALRRKCKGQPSYIDMLTLLHDHTKLRGSMHVEFGKLKESMSVQPLG